MIKIHMPGESEFLDWIATQQRISPLVERAAGDDLAILNWPAEDRLIVGADQIIDGVHFDSAFHSIEAIGAKAINRNLSDCAAMACLPVAALITLALPRSMKLEDAKRLYLAMKCAAERFDCEIVGGDTASWDGKLVISVSIFGKSAGITPIRRDGAKPGDLLFVTGPLGGSILSRHLTFEPRIELARKLASTGKVHAMLDLSDGLSRDLPRLTNASNVAAIIESSLVPIHDDVPNLPRNEMTPTEHALHDGEDYELLIAADATELDGAIRIGRVEAGEGAWMETDGVRSPLAPLGWEHTLR